MRAARTKLAKSMRGYKIGYTTRDGHRGYPLVSRRVLITLQIPKGATVVQSKKYKSSLPGQGLKPHNSEGKCRTNRAKVLSIVDAETNAPLDRAYAWRSGFLYTVGETVRPQHDFDDNIYEDCGSGIHFFETEQQARDW